MDNFYSDHINSKTEFDKEYIYVYRYKYPYIPIFCGDYDEDRIYTILECVNYKNMLFCSKLDDNKIPPVNIDDTGDIISYNINNWLRIIDKESLYSFVREQMSKENNVSNEFYADRNIIYSIINYQNIKKGQNIYININCEADALKNPIIKYKNINGIYNLTHISPNIYELYVDVPNDASALILEAESVADRRIVFNTRIIDYDINTSISSSFNDDYHRTICLYNKLKKGRSIVVKRTENDDPFKNKNIYIILYDNINCAYISYNKNVTKNIEILDDVSNIKILVKYIGDEISGFNDGDAFFTVFIK